MNFSSFFFRVFNRTHIKTRRHSRPTGYNRHDTRKQSVSAGFPVDRRRETRSTVKNTTLKNPIDVNPSTQRSSQSLRHTILGLLLIILSGCQTNPLPVARYTGPQSFPAGVRQTSWQPVPQPTHQERIATQPNRVGYASFYGEELRGSLMANGIPFDPDRLTAASWFYPFGTQIRVEHENRSVVVTITDRGPALRLVRQGRIIDLSEAAFDRLAATPQGLIYVRLYRLPSGS